DDEKIAAHLHDYIEKYGYAVSQVDDFENVMEVFKEERPSLVILDINLPRFDGFYWCRQIRQESICTVIFLSARSWDMDKVMAFENGGYYFITKSFHPDVVMAKIRSQLRRAYGEYAMKQEERVLSESGLTLYPEQFEMTFDDKVVMLTKKEADIME